MLILTYTNVHNLYFEVSVSLFKKGLDTAVRTTTPARAKGLKISSSIRHWGNREHGGTYTGAILCLLLSIHHKRIPPAAGLNYEGSQWEMTGNINRDLQAISLKSGQLHSGWGGLTDNHFNTLKQQMECIFHENQGMKQNVNNLDNRAEETELEFRSWQRIKTLSPAYKRFLVICCI